MFLISHKYKFIFFHVPHTGGTSISNALSKYANWPYKSRFVFEKLAKYIHEQPRIYLFQEHVKAVDVRDKIPDNIWTSYYKFAVCRNPYDWLVSVYSYSKNMLEQKSDVFLDMQKIVKDCQDFSDFVIWAKQGKRTFQKKFLSDQDGILLVDKLIRFENINSDFAEVCEHLSLNIDLPKQNHSRRKQAFTSYYTKEEALQIHEAFKEDFEFLGYEMLTEFK